jgi:hypothetical protein
MSGWWRPADATNAPKTELSGRVEAAWILDGRFLEVRFEGQTVGIPFSAIQILGYDTLTKRYQLIFLESTMTVVNKFEGEFDEASRSIVFSGTIVDPAVSGAYRGVLVLDDARPVFKGFLVQADGSAVQVSEYVYSARRP